MQAGRTAGADPRGGLLGAGLNFLYRISFVSMSYTRHSRMAILGEVKEKNSIIPSGCVCVDRQIGIPTFSCSMVEAQFRLQT